MPSVNNRICNKCKKIVPANHKCTDNTANKMYNKTQRKNDSFYQSSQWRNKRVNILSRDAGLCQNCRREGRTVIGNIVHHIIEVSVNWDLRLTDDNLETICSTCHNKEH